MTAIYISGPMTGLPDLNFPAFHAAAQKLRGQGLTVVNPAEKEGEGDPNKTWSDYLKADIRLLLDCDSIYMLPGWQKSKGAKLEFHIAVELGLSVIFSEQSIQHLPSEDTEGGEI